MDAFAANPLVTFGLMGFGVWLSSGLLMTIVPGLRRDPAFTPREKKTARVLAVLLILAAWVREIFR